MGNRLSKIYTRTGDSGTTGLADGSRVGKDSPRVEAMGVVDELNCALAAILLNSIPSPCEQVLFKAQHALFDIGGELAIPGASTVDEHYVEALESTLDELNEDLPPLKEFILPGGGQASVCAHVARATCRRAERTLWHLAKTDTVNEASLRYLNRLSDLLFVMARALAIGDRGEVYWDPSLNKS